MTHYMRDGNRYSVAPAGALDITELLPLGTYKVGFIEPINTYFLEKVEDFTVTGKIYGKTIAHRDRILRTFEDRPSTTGVLLTGEKGSGKTLLAKMLALQAQERGVPTLVINMPWCGDQFNAFMQAISQPVVVIFDEFEKVYDADDQQKLLTLLDGTYSSKKLFVLTANDRLRVDEHMKNRPGRIFYGIDFTGVDVDFVREYCLDNLVNQAHLEDVVATSRLFQRFNFDVLKALVEEMNRFDEGVDEALEMLNAKPERGFRLPYSIALSYDGDPVPADAMYGDDTWVGNPLTDPVRFYFERDAVPAAQAQRKDDDDDSVHVDLKPQDLTRVNVDNGDFTYEKDSIRLIMTEKVYDSGVSRKLVY